MKWKDMSARAGTVSNSGDGTKMGTASGGDLSDLRGESADLAQDDGADCTGGNGCPPFNG